MTSQQAALKNADALETADGSSWPARVYYAMKDTPQSSVQAPAEAFVRGPLRGPLALGATVWVCGPGTKIGPFWVMSKDYNAETDRYACRLTYGGTIMTQADRAALAALLRQPNPFYPAEG